MIETLMEISKRLEHYETPLWAVRAILAKELMTRLIVDPCAGAGVLTKAARIAGYRCHPYDIQNWGFPVTRMDWLNPPKEFATLLMSGEFTVLMNPPFTLAVEFVEMALLLGARKVVCFCPMSWWTSKDRREFWDRSPPARIHVCAERATCWRHDVPAEDRRNDTPTIYAWFVWEEGQNVSNPPVFRLYKDDAA